MTLEELQNEAEKDLKMDDTELDKESLRIPQLHNKYLIFYNKERVLLKKLEHDFNELKRVKWEYYSGKMDQETLKSRNWEPFPLKILRQDIDNYLEADTDLILLSQKKDIQHIKIDYLEGVLKGIMNRHWTIGNAIKWRQFCNGVI